MKPSLVDVEKIIPKPKPKPVPVAPPINYSKILFNLISFIIVIAGIYVLYVRKNNKIKNKEKYEKDIVNLQLKLSEYEKFENNFQNKLN